MIPEGREVPEEPLVISPGSRLVGDRASGLKRELRTILSEGRDVILDFEDVSFVDSCGLGALVVAHRTASREGRRLSLCSVPENVMALLHLTRLRRIFEIHPDLETARLLLDAVG